MAEGYRPGGAGESGVLRLLAPNPSPMTQAGTNTYLLGTQRLAVIDPGPADADHLAAILRAVDGRPVEAIFVTHSHLDHSPGARPLAAQLGAPILAFGPSGAGRSATMTRLAGLGGGEGVEADFAPDRVLDHGAEVSGGNWTLRAHHTPGHMANHLSFHWLEANAVFTGDTVMGWASTMISPPDGDLGQFLESLDRLEAIGAARFWPGHGDPLDDPAGRCRDLRNHRLSREAAILAALDRPATIDALVAAIYTDTPPALHGAAGRNVLAHLIHLSETGRARAAPAPGPEAIWTRL